MDKKQQPTTKHKKKSLALWLSENPDLKDTLNSRVESANQDYLRSLSGYGRQGEQLAGAGLATSGYGEYLSGLAFSDRQSRVTDAKRDKENAMAKGYSAYLSDYEKTRTSAEKSAMSAILSQSILDKDQAYELAVSHGLSHADALRVSETSTALSADQKEKDTEALRLQVLQKMISYGFKAADGYAYAKAYGFSGDDALSLAKLAEQLYRAKNLGLMNATYQELMNYQNRK